MQISKHELHSIIKEELSEHFKLTDPYHTHWGGGEEEEEEPETTLDAPEGLPGPRKSRASRGDQDYPASEMATITATLFEVADELGVPTTPDEREAIVAELEELLRGQGYELHEQNLILSEPLFLEIDESSPRLFRLLDDIENEDPAALDRIIDAFARGGIDIGTGTPPGTDDLGRGDIVLVPEPEEGERHPAPILPGRYEVRHLGRRRGVPSAFLGAIDEDNEIDHDRHDLYVPLRDIIPYGAVYAYSPYDSKDLDRDLDDPDLTDTEIDVPPVEAPEEEELWDPDDPTIAGGVHDDDVLVPPDEEEEPEEEEAPLKVGDVVRVKENDRDIKPGDYEVAEVRDYTTGASVVVLAAVAGKGGEDRHQEYLETILDNPDVFKINPFFPKIQNPWRFKWFWEEDEVDDDSTDALKKAAKGIRDLLPISPGKMTIGVLGTLGGIAGIVGLVKYISEDEEAVSEPAAAAKGEQIEDLGKKEPKSWDFLLSSLKFILSLALDEGQMDAINKVEILLKAITGAVSVQDLDAEALGGLLDDVPGIEFLDKLPGGREKLIEILIEQWQEMPLEKKVNLILALIPQEDLNQLDATLSAAPHLSEMPGMDWPLVGPEIQELIKEKAGLDVGEDPHMVTLLLAAGQAFGLADEEHTTDAMDVTQHFYDSLEKAKSAGKLERGMMIMDALFEHQQQMNRMKVLAGIK